MKDLYCEVDQEVIEVQMMCLLGCRLVRKRVNVCTWGDLEPHGVVVCDRLLLWSHVWWCRDGRMNSCVGNCV